MYSTDRQDWNLSYWKFSERFEFIYRLYSTSFKLYEREIQTYLDSALNPNIFFQEFDIIFNMVLKSKHKHLVKKLKFKI